MVIALTASILAGTLMFDINLAHPFQAFFEPSHEYCLSSLWPDSVSASQRNPLSALVTVVHADQPWSDIRIDRGKRRF